MIVVGGGMFYIGVSATAIALSSGQFELVPLTCLGATAGGLLMYAGTRTLINSGLIPGTKRK